MRCATPTRSGHNGKGALLAAAASTPITSTRPAWWTGWSAGSTTTRSPRRCTSRSVRPVTPRMPWMPDRCGARRWRRPSSTGAAAPRHAQSGTDAMPTRLLAFVTIGTLAALPFGVAASGGRNHIERRHRRPVRQAADARWPARSRVHRRRGAPTTAPQGAPAAGCAAGRRTRLLAKLRPGPCASPAVQRPALDSAGRLPPGHRRQAARRGLQGSATLAVAPGAPRREGHAAAHRRLSRRRPDVDRVRERIASALKEYVTNPVVTVIVVETVPPSSTSWAK